MTKYQEYSLLRDLKDGLLIKNNHVYKLNIFDHRGAGKLNGARRMGGNGGIQAMRNLVKFPKSRKELNFEPTQFIYLLDLCPAFPSGAEGRVTFFPPIFPQQQSMRWVRWKRCSFFFKKYNYFFTVTIFSTW